MSRITILDQHQAPRASAELLSQIERAMGAQPAMFRAVSHSPAALKSLWGSFGALGSGALPASLTEQLAIAIANRNRCEYCLAAHTVLGQGAGVDAKSLSEARFGRSDNAKTQAALRFALALVDRRGNVSDQDVAEVRHAGFNDAELVELVAHTALNLFTNYINIAFNVPVDFAPVPLVA